MKQTIAILRRWSTRQQSGNYRAAHQFEDMEKICHTLGYETLRIDEGQGSGRRGIAKREHLLRALQMIADGTVQGIGAIEMSRITRDPYGATAAEIKKAVMDANAVVVIGNKVYDLHNQSDKLTFDMHVMIASFEADQILERTWMGNWDHRLTAKTTCARPPLGYVAKPIGIKKNNKVDTELARDPAAAEMMRDFFRFAESAPSHTALARQMNTQGWRIQQDRRKNGTSGETRLWLNSDVARVLENRIYAGWIDVGKRSPANSRVRRLNDQLKESVVPRYFDDLAYVDDTTFQHIQQRFAAVKLTAPRAREGQNILLGIARCLGCGGPLYRRKNKVQHRPNGTVTASNRLFCNRNKFGHQCPKPQEINEHLVLKAVYALIQTFLTPDAVEHGGVAAARLDKQTDGGLLRELQAKLNHLEKRSKGLVTLIADARGDEDAEAEQAFRQERTETQRLIQQTKEQLATLNDVSQAQERLRQFRELGPNFVSFMLERSAPVQREVIRSVFSDVYVDGHGGGRNRELAVVRYKLVGDDRTYEITPDWKCVAGQVQALQPEVELEPRTQLTDTAEQVCSPFGYFLAQSALLGLDKYVTMQ